MSRKKDQQDLEAFDEEQDETARETIESSSKNTTPSVVPLKRAADHPKSTKSSRLSDADEADNQENAEEDETDSGEMLVSEMLANDKSVSEEIVEEALAIEAFTNEIAEQEAAEAEAEEASAEGSASEETTPEDAEEEEIHVDIYAIDIDGSTIDLYEESDTDEILDAEEEITEETVEEATREAIEEVTADIEEEEEILAEQRPQEMERKFDYLENLLDGRRYADFRADLAELNPVDAADFFSELNPHRIPAVFKLLDKDSAAAVFAELDIEVQERIITAMTDREITLIVEELALDDTTELLKELPANMVHRIMKNATPETRTDINRLLAYPERSAGSVMTAEFIDLRRGHCSHP